MPTPQLVATSLYDPNGSLDTGYAMTWSFSNYSTRSGVLAAVPALAAVRRHRDRARLVLAYPLAYAIAFKAGRWKNLMLVLVIAPFFTSFLVRTLAWKSILSDNGFVVNTLQTLHILAADGRLLATSVAVVAGLTYNFLPFMVLPLYASLEKIDLRLIEAGKDLYANGLVASARSPCRCRCRASSRARC